MCLAAVFCCCVQSAPGGYNASSLKQYKYIIIIECDNIKGIYSFRKAS